MGVLKHVILAGIVNLLVICSSSFALDCSFDKNCGNLSTSCQTLCATQFAGTDLTTCTQACGVASSTGTDACTTACFITGSASCSQGCTNFANVKSCCDQGCPVCVNGGTCDAKNPKETCNCPTGYSGATCAINDNDCASNPCVNGKCLDLVNSFQCTCNPGYQGVFCNENINECTTSLCLNGAICVDTIGSFTCSCVQGYSGTLCETVDPCLSSPCINGQCLSNGGKYTCSCSKGYEGDNCEKDAQDSGQGNGATIGIAIGVTLLIVLIFLIAGYVGWKKYKGKPKAKPIPSVTSMSNISNIVIPSNTTYVADTLVHTGQTTILNTQAVIAVPGYLLLNYNTDLRVDDKLGGGGGGVIYTGVLLAEHLKKRHGVEKVVIKHVPDRNGWTDEEITKSFEQEISTMSALSYQTNIVKIVGYTNAPKCIIMERLDGDLFNLLQSQVPLNEFDKISIILDITAAMNATHSMGVIHRDLKTPNLLFQTLPAGSKKKYLVKLCDFGVCKIRQNYIKGLKFENFFGLSIKYAAPEVFGRATMLPTDVPFEDEMKADVYAFAICVWEVLSRSIPWGKDSKEEIQSKVCGGVRPEFKPKTNFENFMFDLTKMCWAQEMTQRPSFREIQLKIDSFGLEETLVSKPPPSTPGPAVPRKPPPVPQPATVSGPVTPAKKMAGRSLPSLPAQPNTSPMSLKPLPSGRALYDYLPNRQDELKITAGDELEILNTNHDGWVFAKKKTDEKAGWIPGNYFQPVY